MLLTVNIQLLGYCGIAKSTMTIEIHFILQELDFTLQKKFRSLTVIFTS